MGVFVHRYAYYVECALKFGGLGLTGYFADVGNRFDFTLVVIAAVEEQPQLHELVFKVRLDLTRLDLT